MNPVLAYCFGNTHDHALRLCGVLRRLARRGLVEVHVISNHPAPAEHTGAPWLRWYECPQSGRIIVSKLGELIERLAPKLFVVDGFPAGIEGELGDILPEFPCACVLVQHYQRPATILRMNLAEFAERHYDLCIAPRDTLKYAEVGRALSVEPLTFWEPDEVLDEVDARLELGYSGRPIMVLRDGIPDSERLFEALKKHCETVGGLRVDWRIHTLDPLLVQRFEGETIAALSPYRLAKAFHLVVAPAGYADFFDCESLGLRALYRPAKDSDDEQPRRAGLFGVADPKILIQRIHDGDLPEPHIAVPSNGSATAARAMLERIGHRQPGLRLTAAGA